MNITNVISNFGQYNWDVINTISNIVLVLALVFITGWYASEVKKQTNLMIKGQMRNRILGEVQDVLTPAINTLTQEIAAIQNKKIFWHRHTLNVCGFDQGLSRFFYSEQYNRENFIFSTKMKGALSDVLTKFSKLNSMFHSHDSLIDDLNKLYVEFEKEIRIPKIQELLIKMEQEFNKGKSATYRLSIEQPNFLFEEYIINIEFAINRIPDSIEPRIDFWEENQEELLEYRNTTRIAEISKQIRSKLTELKEKDITILKKIEKIRENYRKKYHFTDDEIEPFKGLGF